MVRSSFPWPQSNLYHPICPSALPLPFNHTAPATLDSSPVLDCTQHAPAHSLCTSFLCLCGSPPGWTAWLLTLLCSMQAGLCSNATAPEDPPSAALYKMAYLIIYLFSCFFFIVLSSPKHYIYIFYYQPPPSWNLQSLKVGVSFSAVSPVLRTCLEHWSCYLLHA